MQLVGKIQDTDLYTLITKPGDTELLFSADSWTMVQLLLETAGPVAVSTRQAIAPPSSGKGVLLPTGTNTFVAFPLKRGDRLYYVSDSVNRVKVIIQPDFREAAADGVIAAIAHLGQALSSAIFGAARGRAEPKSVQAPICPPAIKAPRF